MSGGIWNYKDADLKNELFDDEPTDVVQDMEISILLFDMLTLLHSYDWYVSGDTGENTWLEAKRKFKDKWFKGDRSERLKQIIDDRLTIVKEELEKII